MPNVMGREFPYTAEGMAAAQQYEQAMGVRGGGMMGFRPVGMEEGGDADMVRLADTLYALMQGGSVEQVNNFIRENLPGLKMAAEIQDSKFNMLRGALRQNAQMQQMPQRSPAAEFIGAPADMGSMMPGIDPLVATGLGRRMAKDIGETRISNTDLQNLQGTMGSMMPEIDPLVLTGLGRRMAEDIGETRISDTDLQNLKRTMGSMTPTNKPYYPELPRMAGGGIMSLRGY